MSERVELCRKLVEARGKDKPVVAFVFGPLGIVSMLRGQQEMFMDLYTAPDEVKKGVEIVSDVLCDWIDQLCATGIDAVMFDTLYASRSIMSAEMWDEFEGVYMTRIAERVRSHGCAVMIHNCGQGAYFDEQYERMKPVLFSFAHPPQGCADMKEAVEKYADKMILMGTIDPGWFMTATPETLKARVEEELAVFGPSERHVLSAGCAYPTCPDFAFPRQMMAYGESVHLQMRTSYPHPALRLRFPPTLRAELSRGTAALTLRDVRGFPLPGVPSVFWPRQSTIGIGPFAHFPPSRFHAPAIHQDISPIPTVPHLPAPSPDRIHNAPQYGVRPCVYPDKKKPVVPHGSIKILFRVLLTELWTRGALLIYEITNGCGGDTRSGRHESPCSSCGAIMAVLKKIFHGKPYARHPLVYQKKQVHKRTKIGF